MIKNKILIVMTLAVLLGALSLGFYKDKGDSPYNRLSKASSNDFNDYIAINQILMWISNNGMGSHDPRSDDSGFYWPGGLSATKTAVFADGLIWGAKVGREIRTGGATYRYGLQAGKIMDNGLADDPSLDKYRIFKIRKNWVAVPDPELRDRLQKDYDEWPGEDGAPYIDIDGDGLYTAGIDEPNFVGDEVLWCVSNDLDAGRTTFLYGTNPMGLEVQTTVFGFNLTGDIGNMVFKKYTTINKGSKILRDMILGYWSDTDLGFAADDYTGCDTVLSLGYTFNGDDTDDDIYLNTPPAMGYDFFQGPIVEASASDSAKFLGEWRHGYRNLPMTAFTFYINGNEIYSDPDLGVAAGSQQMYNYLDGKVWNGDPFIDPNTNQETNFVLAGDPVGKTGWFEGGGWPGGPVPGDRRHLMASGPFTMAPGDTQEIVVGLLITSGNGRLGSVSELKRLDNAAQIAYDLDFDITAPPPAPNLHHFSGDGEITLWWETNAEDYEEVNPLIFNLGLDDTTYNFEGYRIWQFPNISSSLDDGLNLATYDIANGITQITETRNVGDITPVPVEFIVFQTLDEGLTTTIKIDMDEINNGKLVNGNPYYFGVTAYGYNEHSTPQFLESPPIIMEVFPRKKNIDETYFKEPGEITFASVSEGDAHARANYTIVDPWGLKNASYQVMIEDVNGALVWNLFDVTRYNQDATLSKDTLQLHVPYYGAETDDAKFNRVIDGFYVNVFDDGLDSLGIKKSAVRDVLEVVNGNITGDVFGTVGTASNYRILSNSYLPAGNSNDPTRLTLNPEDNMGYITYEIRFTATGSQYYAASMKSPAFNGAGFAGDPLAPNTVPFEIWNLGTDLNDPADDVRLVIKVQDGDAGDPIATTDGQWTQAANGQWEAIYAFSVDPYPTTFDATSPKYSKKQHILGNIVIDGDVPPAGTVIRIVGFRPLEAGDAFEFAVNASNAQDKEAAKSSFDNITVFPNPYFASHELEQSKYNRFVRFLGLPQEATIRLFSLSGVFISKLEKNDTADYIDWNLTNKDGLPVASGMYLAYIDMPGIGEKILKLAVIIEAQYIDRI